MVESLPLPIIYDYRCTGCGECVAHCPESALDMRDGKAVVAHPERCTYCMLCEEVCPTSAISLPFLVIFDEQRR
jgi:NAD-dependent dihydropyrimidine dehydrogenase PreA subunit